MHHEPTATRAPGAREPTSEIYTVSRLNLEARRVIESHFGSLWVEGEISNLARPRSGHLYFSLKDRSCQVRCAMFRLQNRRLAFEPADGMQVLVSANVGMYPERGEFQLVVQYMEESGAGALRRQLEALKRELAAEGLFDEAAKRALPALPGAVGVVTSATGAALRDVLSVMRRRFAAIPVVVYPVPVQGPGAGSRIAAMLDVASRRAEVDVLILARGGGSLEDLRPFNEAAVARAIRRSAIPVVSGVGHETDVTIADLAADRRAATPSAAAEMVSPDASELRERLGALGERLARRMTGLLTERRQRVDWLARRLVDPRRRLGEHARRLETLQARLVGAAREATRARHALLARRLAALERKSPEARLGGHRARLERARPALEAAAARAIETRRARLAGLLRALEAVGPSGTLERGYAIVTRAADGSLVRDAGSLAAGERIDARLARGSLTAAVEATRPEREER